jgi:peptide/nickel transport system substrate-binding protein
MFRQFAVTHIRSLEETIMKSSKLFHLLSLLVIASLALAACGPAASQTAGPATGQPTTAPEPTTPAASKVVTISFTQELDNLSPLYTAMWFSQITQPFWLRGLWRFDDKGNPVLDIAAEIPSEANGGVADGGKTITIKLNPDAKWSDGQPITADDFVFTYQMITSPKNTVSSAYPYDTVVESVEAQDPQTVVVKFSEPFAPWFTTIFSGSTFSTPPLPKHILEPVFESAGTLDGAEWNRAPLVSSGPFVFGEWESGSHLRFIRNENWFGPAPKVDEIFIRFVPDDAAQMAAIQAGDTDIGVFLSFSDFPTVEGSGVAQMAQDPGGYAESWYFNFDPERSHPAIQDPNVRRAIVMATDREKITQDLLGGETAPVGTFWDATPPFGNPDIKPYAYDPDEAARLLDEAGWTMGADGVREKTLDGEVVKLKLKYITNSRQLRKDVMAVVKQMWAGVGIDSELVNNANDIYFGTYGENGPLYGDYDIAQYSNAPSFPDPDVAQFTCEEIPTPDKPEGNNFQGYCNAELDALFAEQARTVDREARIQLFYQIAQIMYDDVVWVGLWNDPDLWSVNNRLKNVVFSGGTAFWNVTDWDIP